MRIRIGISVLGAITAKIFFLGGGKQIIYKNVENEPPPPRFVTIPFVEDCYCVLDKKENDYRYL